MVEDIVGWHYEKQSVRPESSHEYSSDNPEFFFGFEVTKAGKDTCSQGDAGHWPD